MEDNNVFAAKCETCGADMVFDPTTQTLKCPFCGTQDGFDADRDVREIDILEGIQEQWCDNLKVISCQNCGAEVVFQSKEVSKVCPYCGMAHVVEIEKQPGLKPNCVFPFTITKEQAVENVKKWVKKRLYAPSKFKKFFIEDKVYGVYEPGYTFDSMTYSFYSGVIGKRRERVVRDRDGHTHTETYVEWHNVSGRLQHFFDDVLINGSKNLTQNFFISLAPYNYQTLVNYDAKFLAGFSASMTDKSVKQGFGEAKIIMDNRIRSMILSKYNCDVIQYLNVKTNHERVSYKYVLFPIYHLIYSFKKKTDNKIFINGNTGKVSGKTPVSGIKVVFTILLVIAICVILYMLYRNK